MGMTLCKFYFFQLFCKKKKKLIGLYPLLPEHKQKRAFGVFGDISWPATIPDLRPPNIVSGVSSKERRSQIFTLLMHSNIF